MLFRTDNGTVDHDVVDEEVVPIPVERFEHDADIGFACIIAQVDADAFGIAFTATPVTRFLGDELFGRGLAGGKDQSRLGILCKLQEPGPCRTTILGDGYDQ